MAWDHLSITKPHLVYIILGGFTSLFMLCSSIIKERMYIGEATVATICGIIFGPHAANLINPFSWGNTDEVTLEFSRIVLVVQCFAVGVELPKFYMEKHWKSVVFLLLPVMAFGWLITSLFIFWMVPTLNWLDSLVVAACVTATDPVLASSVVGKGKFARRVPKHLRDLISAESGCNDGMAFPFVYLALYLIHYHKDARETTFHWLVFTVLYECIFGAFYGFMVGYIARRGIIWAHERDMIDKESFLSFYFVLSLFCAGSGSILGLDDLLVGFAAGVGFSNDGWFSEKTEESHVSNVIDLLLNLSYFVYLGTIIPWADFANVDIGLTPWRLVVIALMVIFFRRIPIMLICKPFIPDLKTWREALFAGHFGPIGVGAIFVAILARAELQTGTTIPLDYLPSEEENEHAVLIKAVWPIVTFLVVASIVVHGSSIAVFTLGKRINTLTLTMSYTKDFGEDGPDWLRRLPRISSQSRSQAKSMSSMEDDQGVLPPGILAPHEYGGFLRRKVEDSQQQSRPSSVASKRRKRKKWDDGIGPGGPISQSAIFPQRRAPEMTVLPTSPLSPEDDSGSASPTAPAPARLRDHDPEKVDLEAQTFTGDSAAATRGSGRTPADSQAPMQINVFEEGNHLIIEDQDGEVLEVTSSREKHPELPRTLELALHNSAPQEPRVWTYSGVKSKWDRFINEEKNKRKAKDKHERKHDAKAYLYGNTIIVEDKDGEVVKRYELPQQNEGAPNADLLSQSLKYMGIGSLVNKGNAEPGPSTSRRVHWPSFSYHPGPDPECERRTTAAELEDEDDRHIRFRIGGEEGQRMGKDDFIRTVGLLDPRTRDRALSHSDASAGVKEMARRGRSFSNTQPSAQAVGKAAGQTAGQMTGEAAPSLPSRIFTASGAAGPATEMDDSDTTKAGSRSDSPPSPTTRLGADRPMGRGRSGSSASAVIMDRNKSAAEPSVAEDTPAAQARRQHLFSAIPDDDVEETPAERRRREAALGITSIHEDDSDDDNTDRVVPAPRRGIRWMDVPERN